MLARRALGLVAVVAVTALTACSNQDSPINRPKPSGTGTASPVNGVQTITLITGDDYRFHPSTIIVHPGRVHVILKNTGKAAPHNFQVVGFPATFVPLAGAGTTSMATFDAPGAGTYTFECTIHVKQGQVGKLVVLPS